ncbi:hypothetical protein DL93DRAFT_2155500 [Clavulina sp. PMI_390]|nr:hypothetical protein DL93DRAFT_2155500 [Clavulina sp. PMI_390]
MTRKPIPLSYYVPHSFMDLLVATVTVFCLPAIIAVQLSFWFISAAVQLVLPIPPPASTRPDDWAKVKERDAPSSHSIILQSPVTALSLPSSRKATQDTPESSTSWRYPTSSEYSTARRTGSEPKSQPTTPELELDAQLQTGTITPGRRRPASYHGGHVVGQTPNLSPRVLASFSKHQRTHSGGIRPLQLGKKFDLPSSRVGSPRAEAGALPDVDDDRSIVAGDSSPPRVAILRQDVDFDSYQPTSAPPGTSRFPRSSLPASLSVDEDEQNTLLTTPIVERRRRMSDQIFHAQEREALLARVAELELALQEQQKLAVEQAQAASPLPSGSANATVPACADVTETLSPYPSPPGSPQEFSAAAAAAQADEPDGSSLHMTQELASSTSKHPLLRLTSPTLLLERVNVAPEDSLSLTAPGEVVIGNAPAASPIDGS